MSYSGKKIEFLTLVLSEKTSERKKKHNHNSFFYGCLCLFFVVFFVGFFSNFQSLESYEQFYENLCSE